MTSRGITVETASTWRLGYVLDPLPGHERMKNMLAIPYLTPAGVACIKFRCIESHACDGHPKYDSEAGAGTYLFGVTAFQLDSPFICVTEGELDAISASVAELPAVGVSGATKWQPHWRYCFEGYSEVIVLQDGDSPGAKLGGSVMRHLDNARVITFPEGHDVNSFLVEHGPVALRRRVGIDGA